MSAKKRSLHGARGMQESPSALMTSPVLSHGLPLYLRSKLCKSRLHNCSTLPEWSGHHAGIVQQAVGQIATSIVQQPVAQLPGRNRNGALTP